MNNNFNPFQLLSETAESATTGELTISANSVIWELNLVEGKLESAVHSLQSWDTAKYYLLRLGYNDAAKISPLINKNISENTQLINHIINQLETEQHLNSIQKAQLTKKITEDALESLLCLTNAEYKWVEKNSLKSSHLKSNIPLDIKLLITTLQAKLQGWQKLHQFITSPHQRPYCINPSLIEQSIPNGTLSITVLRQLVKSMQGLSIRELALLVKQDDLKLAQLLFVYIKNKVLQLYPPKSPLNRLPQIPLSFTQNYQQSILKTPISTKETSTPIAPLKPVANLETSTPTLRTNPLTSTQKKSKIICIDDSPVMLEMIANYLGTEKYELMTVEEPMKSLSSMFKSNADLILMDISMPSINGNKLCQIFKRSPVFKSTPIVLISGNTKILNQETLDATGAADFLAKPFTQKVLLNMIEKYCNLSQAKQTTKS